MQKSIVSLFVCGIWTQGTHKLKGELEAEQNEFAASC